MITHEIHEQMLMTLLAPIGELLTDPSISEIMLNGPNEVYCERAGKLSRCRASFGSDAALLAALRNIAQFVGRPFDRQHPILEGRLPDGSRVQAVIPPAAPVGPMVSIRRFSKVAMTVERLVDNGTLDRVLAQTLQRAVYSKRNVIVSGGTGSGKTSLLNALSSFIPDDERVVVIEDSRELQLQRSHVVNLEAQPGDAAGRGRIEIRELFRASLRMRPDRIVLGEIRGAEAVELIQAMTSGHGGCLCTLHASHPHDALARLETMASMSELQMPLRALREQIASGVDLVVQIERQRNGQRRVTQVAQVGGLDDAGRYLWQEVGS
ncbi:MAG TPA: ATPase, T2SS/T4P/T4SS family [Polyangiales bacterium]